ncbi:MAG: dihydropteroate synthase, partial [Gammaproteobacteria bacterium]|nr:dihydropteroate synthase [Gammaproteobacteria bacterium]
DPSYRVQVSEEGIHIFNRDGLVAGIDPFELFPKLGLLQDDAPHAFYMGVELAKAQIAWQLGKRYIQDEELRWGCATKPKEETLKQVGADKGDTPEHTEGIGAVDTSYAYKAAGSTLQARKRKRKAS